MSHTELAIKQAQSLLHTLAKARETEATNKLEKALEQFLQAYDAVESSDVQTPEEVLRSLVEWANLTGGWEAPCWKRAEQLVASLDS